MEGFALTPGFERLVSWVIAVLVGLAGVVVVVLGAWAIFQAILAGGKGRAVWGAVLSVVFMAVAYSALVNYKESLEVARMGGEMIYRTVLNEVRVGFVNGNLPQPPN